MTDIEPGDLVLVRVRDDNSKLIAKFVAECVGLRGIDNLGSTKLRLELPFGERVTLGEYDAEFEQVSSKHEVNF